MATPTAAQENEGVVVLMDPEGLAGAAGPGMGEMMVHVNSVCAVPVPSETLTVTLNAPSVVGVPDSAPVEALIVIPGGRFAALHASGVASGSAAVSVWGDATPCRLVSEPGFVITGT